MSRPQGWTIETLTQASLVNCLAKPAGNGAACHETSSKETSESQVCKFLETGEISILSYQSPFARRGLHLVASHPKPKELTSNIQDQGSTKDLTEMDQANTNDACYNAKSHLSPDSSSDRDSESSLDSGIDEFHFELFVNKARANSQCLCSIDDEKSLKIQSPVEIPNSPPNMCQKKGPYRFLVYGDVLGEQGTLSSLPSLPYNLKNKGPWEYLANWDDFFTWRIRELGEGHSSKDSCDIAYINRGNLINWSNRPTRSASTGRLSSSATSVGGFRSSSQRQRCIPKKGAHSSLQFSTANTFIAR